MPSTILRHINKEVQDFQTKQIQIVPGLTFNQYDTLQKIYFYFNSKFQTGDIDDEGDRKYFINISKNPCKVYSKAIDFDTKNIRMLTAGGGDPLKTWFMERDLKYWMRDIQFGKVLNRIFKELPIYGSVVLKIVNGRPYFIDLRNFIVEQSADTLADSNYITEIHNLTVGGFRAIAKEMKWPQSKVDEAVKKFYEMKGVSHLRLYERYGEVETLVDGNPKYEYRRVFFADVGVDEFDQYGNIKAQHAGVEMASDLFTAEEVQQLYWEFHAEKIPGRWLGIGVVETLFEPQVKENETANLESKMAHFLALFLFQTRDSAVSRNYINDARNGHLLNVDSEITQVAIQDRNGAFWNAQSAKWMNNRAELTFSYDVVQGERLPAGTPLGSAKIAIGQTLSYFEGIQENVALDIKEMLYEVVVPQFEKENSGEHTLRLVGQDLEAYIAMVKNELVLKEMIRVATTTGKFPTKEDKDTIELAITEAIKQGKEKILDVPKGYYEGIKYDIDIDITGESLDTRVKSAAQFAILQAMTADPTITTDPVKKAILIDIGEENGINLSKYFSTEETTAASVVPGALQTGRAGGGVSSPALSQAIPGEVTSVA